MKSKLERAINNYNTALFKLEKAFSEQDIQSINERVFDVLISRDLIQIILKDRTKYSSRSLSTLAQLDSRLRSHSKIIAQVVSQLFEQKSIIPPSKEAWWWYLEIYEKPLNPFERYARFSNWYWFLFFYFILVSYLCFGITLRYITAIKIQIPTEITAAIIIGAIALIPYIPKLMTFLSDILDVLAGRIYSGILEKPLNNLLNNLPIPSDWRDKLTNNLPVIYLILVLLILSLIYSSLPMMAEVYNEYGVELYNHGQLDKSEIQLKRATVLEPSYPEPHYNLGIIYEKKLDYQRAKIEYQLAAKKNFSGAYNRLARLYILEDKYSRAITLLVEGLKYMRDVSDTEIEYAIHKNLGWVRLKQKRYEQAEAELRFAIDLNPKEASAHCLLAQTLEIQNYKEKALIQWENCLKYASIDNLDEDEWIGIAQQRLKVNNKGTLKN